MKARVDIPVERLRPFCEKWKIIEFSLFGSVLTDAFGPDSDVDVLITFSPSPGWSLLDHVRMVHELTELLGRKVDVAQEALLENPFRRRHILLSKELIYAA